MAPRGGTTQGTPVKLATQPKSEWQALQATEPVWAAVRTKWDQLIARKAPLKLKGAPDKDGLFKPLFEYAQAIVDSGKPKTVDDITLPRKCAPLWRTFLLRNLIWCAPDATRARSWGFASHKDRHAYCVSRDVPAGIVASAHLFDLR